MTLTWTKEASPRWDADKQRLFGPAELAAVGLVPPAPGAPVADEWLSMHGFREASRGQLRRQVETARAQASDAPR
jgi:hypothetical protein